MECRTVPAWWSVAAPVPAAGTAGSTDATHAGELSFGSQYTPDADGTVTVWADTPAEAAGQALTGTLTVTAGPDTFDQTFGPASVGTAAAEQKPFLVTVSGTTVGIAFEDMAGQPGCDYDYNDRSWGGVSVAGTTAPEVARLDAQVWPCAQVAGDYALVTSVVTLAMIDGVAKYKWQYELNNAACDWTSPDWPEYPASGMAGLSIGGDPAVVSAVETISNDWGWGGHPGSLVNDPGGATWLDPNLGDTGNMVFVGDMAHFWYYTDPRPVVQVTGQYYSIGVAGGGGGLALGPGEGFADITIDGDLSVGATDPNIPGSKPVVTEFSPKKDANEDTIGGLVLRNPNNKADNNIVPRQQITVQKLKDAVGNPAVGGQVTLTVPGQVKLFDKPAGGNVVATGTKFDNMNLPKTLWVEGAVASTTMRDAKIKAEPAGNPAGADDVSFTVLWVDVVVATSGTISANNDKRQHKKDITFDAAGKNTDALGISTVVVSLDVQISWSVEGRGLVHPAEFSYPGSDVILRRVWNRKGYITPPLGQGKAIVIDSKGFTEDTSLQEWRDDNPLDSGGYIYDLDFPGWNVSVPITKQAQGTTARYRANFKQTAAITINDTNIRASGIYSYYVRFSLVQTGMGNTYDWELITPSDIAGDNKAFGPDQTKLSANLS